MSVSSPKAKPLSEGIQRRRELRRRKRLSLLMSLWRLLALGGTSAGLGWLLLQHGWVLRGPEQVQVSGAWGFSRAQIIQAAELRFPLQLLELDPVRVQTNLAKTLPVEQIQVQRKMLPAQLRISLKQRQAVAKARRRTPSGLEFGFIDRTGTWISREQQAKSTNKSAPTLLVVGWQQRYANTFEQLLKQLPARAQIQQLQFRRNGDLWLLSPTLGPVRFGPIDNQLSRRLQVLNHLSSNWNGKPSADAARAWDLSNPEQPELVLKASVKKKPSASEN